MRITLGFVPGIIAFGLPKLAVISLLMQLLAPSRLHAALLWAFGAICLVLLVACIVWTYAQCDPPRAMWTFDLPGAKCSKPGATVPVSVAAGGESTTCLCGYVEPWGDDGGEEERIREEGV